MTTLIVHFTFRAAGGMRRGNMGHLTRIANAVVQNLEQGPVQTHISEVIRGEPTTFLSFCPLSLAVITTLIWNKPCSLLCHLLSVSRVFSSWSRHCRVQGFSLSRTIHGSSAELRSQEPITRLSFAHELLRAIPSLEILAHLPAFVFNLGNLEDLPSMHIWRPSV